MGISVFLFRIFGGFVMKEIFGVPQIVAEAREQAVKTAKPGKKPGMNWVLIVLICSVIHFVGMGIASAPLAVLEVVNVALKQSGSETIQISETLTMAVLHLCLIFELIMYCLFVKFCEKRKIRTMGFVKDKAGINLAVGAVSGFALFSLSVLFCIVTGAVKVSLTDNVSVLMVLIALPGWFIQSMTEEVCCRGFLLTSIARRYSVTLGIIINALFFGVYHILNGGFTVIPLINTILFGVFTSIIFVKTGNLWACGALHALWNFTQGNIFGVQVSGHELQDSVFTTSLISGKEILNGGSYGLEGGLGVLLVLLLGTIAIALIPIKKREA